MMWLLLLLHLVILGTSGNIQSLKQVRLARNTLQAKSRFVFTDDEA